MKETPAIFLVLVGIVVLMVLMRYAPRAAGWIVLTLTLGLLLLATQKGGMISWEH